MLKAINNATISDSNLLPTECTLTLHKRGQEVLDALLKSADTSRGSKLRAVEELESTDMVETDEQSQNQLFTIFDAVELYAKKSTVPLSLRLACQRIFVSRFDSKYFLLCLYQLYQNIIFSSFAILLPCFSP